MKSVSMSWMLRLRPRIFWAAVAFLAWSGSAFAQANATATDYAPGQLIVKFRPRATDHELTDAWQRGGLRLIKWLQLKDPNHPGITHVSTHLDVQQALRILERHPAIEYAEPNYRIYRTATTPNDPYYSSQWGLHNIGGSRSLPDADHYAPESSDITTGCAEVPTCGPVTGVDHKHSGLSRQSGTEPE